MNIYPNRHLSAEKFKLKSGFAGVAAALLITGSAQGALILTGVYDPASDANDADQSGTFLSGSTGGITAANVLNLATFQSAVATAFTNGNGGVIDFDGTGDSLTGGNTFTTNSFGGRVLSFVNTTGNVSIGTNSTGTGRLAISGTQVLGGQPDLNFNSFSLTGGSPGDLLTHFGMTILQRNQGRNFTVTASFSDGSTLGFNPISINSGSSSTEDTFFGFVAPTGESITGVFFDESSNNFTSFDDIGFIVTPIPEPSSTALLGLGGLALILRRRRS